MLNNEVIMNKTGFYFLLSTFPFLLIFSCTRLPNVQGEGETFMQGVWNQDSLGVQTQLQNYTQYHFKFTCDSFYVDFTTHAKINYYNEECFNGGLWKEYAKGTYQVRNDSLFLVGDFTKENYKQKISGCYRIGRYVNGFKMLSKSDNKIELLNAKDGTELILNLKERINCVPQPL